MDKIIEAIRAIENRKEIIVNVTKDLRSMLANIKEKKGLIDVEESCDRFFNIIKNIPYYLNREDYEKNLKKTTEKIAEENLFMILWEEIERILIVLEHRENELGWVIEKIR